MSHEERIRAVVGLGNPGPRYARTRHNIGFRLLDRLGKDLRAGAETDHGSYHLAWADTEWGRVALIRPMVFMNRSGWALAAFAEETALEPGAALVVQDDIWLPFGAIRFRERGGAGGHNGLASVLEFFGTDAVPRLRLGVGSPEGEEDLADYVLDDFSGDEEKEIEPWLARASLGVRTFLHEGPEAAMSRFNG